MRFSHTMPFSSLLKSIDSQAAKWNAGNILPGILLHQVLVSRNHVNTSFFWPMSGETTLILQTCVDYGRQRMFPTSQREHHVYCVEAMRCPRVKLTLLQGCHLLIPEKRAFLIRILNCRLIKAFVICPCMPFYHMSPICPSVICFPYVSSLNQSSIIWLSSR